jgi:hypothetical protein
LNEQASVVESTNVAGEDNVLSVLLAMTQEDFTGAEQGGVGFPSGNVSIMGLKWPEAWGAVNLIPVHGYRTAGYGLREADGLLIVPLQARPQVHKSHKPSTLPRFLMSTN